ncbi:MAG: glycosyltransferase family 4 protein, partial [Pyrinomonadaceae bacterium]
GLGSRLRIGGPAPAPQDGLRRWLERLSLDLIHFPTPTPPHPHEHVPYVVPPLLDVPAPHVVTVHDVQELHFPEYFSPAQRAVRATHHWEALYKARRVIVSYDHVKADLLKYFGLPETKVSVCPIPNRSISLREPTAVAARAYDEKYRSWQPFLLYPAQTWPHKNHRRLLQALRSVREGHDTDLRLICTGHHDDRRAEVLAQVEALGLGGAVLFTGVVPEDELCWLYRHTALVTIPTEYEAGSFPLLEAMMLGAPVICSDVTSLPETIGDRRFVFSPHDAREMSELILRVLTDAGLREANVANSTRQAARLREVDAAAYLYDAYGRALRGAS